MTSKNCTYCGSRPVTESYSMSKFRNKELSLYKYNGLDRINNKLGYEKNNIVPCCAMCNRMKLDHKVEEFKKHINKIYKFLIERKIYAKSDELCSK
jgi:hypothetical protein